MKSISYTISLLLLSALLHAQELKLNKPIATSNASSKYNMFGWQIAHGNDFVFASAPFDDSTNVSTGFVHVYHKNGVSLDLVQSLSVPSTYKHIRFGMLIAHSGDYFVAMSQLPIQTGAGYGNIHLFHYEQSKWVLTHTFGGQAGNFGVPSSMAMDGNTLVIGNNFLYSGHLNGTIAVYTISNNTATLSQSIEVSGLKEHELIGKQVAIHQNTLAFSSSNADGADHFSGRVWIYQKNNQTWQFLQELDQPDGSSYDKFGSALSIDYPTIVVGAMRQSTNTTNNKKCGAVYVYRFNQNGINLEAKLTADFAANHYDYFGTSVSVHQNLLAVGASGDDFAGHNTGAVYVFKRNGNSWQQVNKIIGGDVNDDALFGNHVAVFNGDVLSSAQLQETDTSKKDEGGVYYFQHAEIATGLASIGQHKKDNIRCFPNPFQDQLNITIPVSTNASKVLVYNINGAIVYETSEVPSNGELVISTSSFAKGTYIISIKAGDLSKNVVVVKQ